MKAIFIRNTDCVWMEQPGEEPSVHSPRVDNRICSSYTLRVGLLDEFFESLEGFQWDEGNAVKNWERHEVSQAECEQLFLNRPIVVTTDEGHSKGERRFAALGHADSGRHLTIVFTVRGTLLRVISARPMSRRERGIYVKRAESIA